MKKLIFILMASSLFMGCATIGCCLNKEDKKTETSEPNEPIEATTEPNEPIEAKTEPIEPTEPVEGVMPEVPDVKMPEMPKQPEAPEKAPTAGGIPGTGGTVEERFYRDIYNKDIPDTAEHKFKTSEALSTVN